MEDTDNFGIAVMEYSVKQEVFASFESSQTVKYLVIPLPE